MFHRPTPLLSPDRTRGDAADARGPASVASGVAGSDADRYRRQLQAITDNASVALFIMDARQQCVFMNPAAEELTGYRLDELSGRPLHDVIHHTHPDGTPYLLEDCPIDRAFPENNQERGEETFVHKRGHFYTVAYTASPIRENGVTVGTVVEVRDITEEKRAQDALRRSEGLLRGIVETTPECVKVVDRSGRLLQMNAAGLRMVEADRPDEVCGGDVLDLIAPEYRDEWLRNHERVCQGESLSWTFRLRGLGGTYRWMETHAAPLTLPDGSTAHMAVTRDVTARHEDELRRRALLDELNHRVKNTLATVLSLVRQTRKGTDSPESFHELFESRLLGLSEAHNLLTDAGWEGVSLRDLVARTLMPYTGGGAIRVAPGAPEIKLGPNSTVTLQMILLELAANAARFGAFSVPDGRVELSWSLEPVAVAEGDAGPALRIDWVELDGPPVEPPARRGFGRRLLEQGVTGELEGELTYEFPPSGVRCRMRLPLSSKVRLA
ncbi:PAS domain S-box protein [Azospirillum sp. SYSU D00513]|uniref:PAS domain S-box protein n=1 Tax=Azospirillum sp. SYSU D00513 TaxID=2812561 RepID=UPI001A974FBB|nr:PAS domain S-box protein [Azospirillum sp. SYSU D00513]